jgi:hypothetical protein
VSFGMSVHGRLCYGKGPGHISLAPWFDRDDFGG